ncbi:MAG: aminomethyl-transferring glycine dehydrogenase subunit GcvPA [Tissierellia bacterium]|nr:aminomethyl-transferring glycine dehydrogenase subunit GcvPA [Tissierellia bacterium]
MHRYIPNNGALLDEMLKDIGISSMDELFRDIPQDLQFKGNLDIPGALSEMELLEKTTKLAELNKSSDQLVNFLGAGVYDHFVPLVIDHIISRSEFYTSYTPYQAEVSQGTLQAIFEYQSLITQLTGMEVSNASMYDGSNAAIEAAILSLNAKRKSDTVLISEGVHPEVIEVIKTYLHFRQTNVKLVPLTAEGKTDLAKAEELMGDGVASIMVQNPNFFGVIEDVGAVADFAKSNKIMSIDYVDPISLGILEAPGNQGVDVVVGDGQSLGNGLNFGGPYLGIMAMRKKDVRKIPGRVVGLSKDVDGNRAFVLTLQAREQHIRRFKATSNICSNQSLNMLVASIYLNTMGKEGLREVAVQSASKAAYLKKALLDTGLFEEVYSGKTFKEFTLAYKGDLDALLKGLEEEGFLGGVNLERFGRKGQLLIAVTEKRTKAQMDAYVDAVRRLS